MSRPYNQKVAGHEKVKPWFHPGIFFRVFQRKPEPAEAIQFGYTIEIAILWNI